MLIKQLWSSMAGFFSRTLLIWPSHSLFIHNISWITFCTLHRCDEFIMLFWHRPHFCSPRILLCCDFLLSLHLINDFINAVGNELSRDLTVVRRHAVPATCSVHNFIFIGYKKLKHQLYVNTIVPLPANVRTPSSYRYSQRQDANQ